MSYSKKEILRLHVAQIEMQMQLQEQAALRDKVIHKRIDMLATMVSRCIEATQIEWSDGHDEVKEILGILEDSKLGDLIRKADSGFQHRHEQLEAMLAEFKTKIETMPDDE
jgi:hypothetical protein